VFFKASGLSTNALHMYDKQVKLLCNLFRGVLPGENSLSVLNLYSSLFLFLFKIYSPPYSIAPFPLVRHANYIRNANRVVNIKMEPSDK